jgi:hypothetical protein
MKSVRSSSTPLSLFAYSILDAGQTETDALPRENSPPANRQATLRQAIAPEERGGDLATLLDVRSVTAWWSRLGRRHASDDAG